ncbi:hypothetical protein GIW81_04045 [Hyphomicrobium sp. xq]|uniref:Uncharacterized protein n=1 Tax=Hyphomicrobium album TaxID=2665159 RepID=A0A6I3KF34_9HYPH|nr:hypothetical protein [Hyphomicrobium album]MTD93504.1 hypothetical protein [Hyphomicrobium album]
MTGDIETWRRRGEAARLAHETVNRAFREHVRERDPDRYTALLQDFWTKTAAALPSTDAAFMPGLANGHVRFVETGIAFLEADPWFFRSGYEKQKIIRHLKRAPLTQAQRQRLARVVLAAIDGHAAGVPENRDRVEFRHFGRLACAIWSDFLDEEVARRMQSPDPGIRRRATWVAEAAISAGKA